MAKCWMNRQAAMTDILPAGEQRSPFMLYAGGLFGLVYVVSLAIIFTLRRRCPIVVPLTNPPDGETFHEYIVTFQTSLRPFSGLSKSAKVCIQLIGEFDDSPVFRLEQNQLTQDILRRGCLDIFVIHTENDLGSITALNLNVVSSKSPDVWRLAIVSVRKTASNDCWIAQRLDKMVCHQEMNTSITLTHEEYELKKSYGDVIHDYFIFLGVKHVLFSPFFTTVKLGTVSSPVLLILFHFSLATVFTATLAVYVLNQSESIPWNDLPFCIAGVEWRCIVFGLLISVAISWLAETLLRNICPVSKLEKNFIFRGLQELKLDNNLKKNGRQPNAPSEESAGTSSFSEDSLSVTKQTSRGNMQDIEAFTRDFIDDVFDNFSRFVDENLKGNLDTGSVVKVLKNWKELIEERILSEVSDGLMSKRNVIIRYAESSDIILEEETIACPERKSSVVRKTHSYAPYFGYGKCYKIFWQMVPPISPSEYNLWFKGISSRDMSAVTGIRRLSEGNRLELRSSCDITQLAISSTKCDSAGVLKNESDANNSEEIFPSEFQNHKDNLPFIISVSTENVLKENKTEPDAHNSEESSVCQDMIPVNFNQRKGTLPYSISFCSENVDKTESDDHHSEQSDVSQRPEHMIVKENSDTTDLCGTESDDHFSEQSGVCQTLEQMIPEDNICVSRGRSLPQTSASQPQSYLKPVQSHSGEKQIGTEKKDSNIYLSHRQSPHKTSFSQPQSSSRSQSYVKPVQSSCGDRKIGTEKKKMEIQEKKIKMVSPSDMSLFAKCNYTSYSQLKPRIKRYCSLVLEIVVKAVLKSCHDCLLEINRNDKRYMKLISDSVDYVKTFCTNILEHEQNSVQYEEMNPDLTHSGKTDILTHIYVKGIISLTVAKLQMKINAKLDTLPPCTSGECQDAAIDDFAEQFVNVVYAGLSECLYQHLVDNSDISGDVEKLDHWQDLLENEVFKDVNNILLSTKSVRIAPKDHRESTVPPTFKQCKGTLPFVISVRSQNILTKNSDTTYVQGSETDDPFFEEGDLSQALHQLFSVSRSPGSHKTSPSTSQSCVKPVQSYSMEKQIESGKRDFNIYLSQSPSSHKTSPSRSQSYVEPFQSCSMEKQIGTGKRDSNIYLSQSPSSHETSTSRSQSYVEPFQSCSMAKQIGTGKRDSNIYLSQSPSSHKTSPSRSQSFLKPVQSCSMEKQIGTGKRDSNIYLSQSPSSHKTSPSTSQSYVEPFQSCSMEKQIGTGKRDSNIYLSQSPSSHETSTSRSQSYVEPFQSCSMEKQFGTGKRDSNIYLSQSPSSHKTSPLRSQSFLKPFQSVSQEKQTCYKKCDDPCNSCSQMTLRIKRDCSFVIEMVVKAVLKSCHDCLLEINRNDKRYVKLISDSVDYVETVCVDFLERLQNSIQYKNINPDLTHIPECSSAQNAFKQTHIDSEGEKKPEMFTHVYVNGVVSWGIAKIQMEINLKLNTLPPCISSEYGNDSLDGFAEHVVNDIYDGISEFLYQSLNGNCDISDVEEKLDYWQELLEKKVFKEVSDALSSRNSDSTTPNDYGENTIPEICEQLKESLPAIDATLVSDSFSQKMWTEISENKPVDLSFDVQWKQSSDRQTNRSDDHSAGQKDVSQTLEQENPKSYDDDKYETQKLYLSDTSSPTTANKMKSVHLFSGENELKMDSSNNSSPTTTRKIKSVHLFSGGNELIMDSSNNSSPTTTKKKKSVCQFPRQNENLPAMNSATVSGSPSEKRLAKVSTRNPVYGNRLTVERPKGRSSSDVHMETVIPCHSCSDHECASQTQVSSDTLSEASTRYTDSVHLLSGRKGFKTASFSDLIKHTVSSEKGYWSFPMEMKLKIKRDCSFVLEMILKSALRSCRDHLLEDGTLNKRYVGRISEAVRSMETLCSNNLERLQHSLHHIEHEKLNPDFTHIPGTSSVPNVLPHLPSDDECGRKPEMLANIYANGLTTMAVDKLQREITDKLNLRASGKNKMVGESSDNFAEDFVDDIHISLLECLYQHLDGTCDFNAVVIMLDQWQQWLENEVFKEVIDALFSDRYLSARKTCDIDNAFRSLNESIHSMLSATVLGIPSQRSLTEQLVKKNVFTKVTDACLTRNSDSRAPNDSSTCDLSGKESRPEIDPSWKPSDMENAFHRLNESLYSMHSATVMDSPSKKGSTHQLLEKKFFKEVNDVFLSQIGDSTAQNDTYNRPVASVNDGSQENFTENSENTLLSQKGPIHKVEQNSSDVHNSESDGQYFEYGDKFKILWKILPVISDDSIAVAVSQGQGKSESVHSISRVKQSERVHKISRVKQSESVHKISRVKQSESGHKISRVKQLKTCNSYDLIKHVITCTGCDWLFCKQIKMKIVDDCFVVLEKAIKPVITIHDKRLLGHEMKYQRRSMVSQTKDFIEMISSNIIRWLENENRGDDGILTQAKGDRSNMLAQMFVKGVIAVSPVAVSPVAVSSVAVSPVAVSSVAVSPVAVSPVAVSPFKPHAEMTLEELAEHLANSVIESCENELTDDLKQVGRVQAMCTAATEEALEELLDDYDIPTYVFLSFLIKQKAVRKLISLGCSTTREKDIPAVVKNTFAYALFGETEAHFKDTDVLVSEAWIYRILLKTNQLASFVNDVKTLFNLKCIVQKVRVYINKKTENVVNSSLDRACLTLADEMNNELAADVIENIKCSALLPEFIEIIIQTKVECDLATEGCMAEMDQAIGRIITEATALCVSQDRVSEQHQHIQASLSRQTFEKATKSPSEEEKLHHIQKFTKDLQPLTRYIRFIQYDMEKSNKAELQKHWVRTNRKHEELMAINMQNIVDSYYVSKELPPGYTEQELYIAEYVLTENLHKRFPAAILWMTLILLMLLTALAITYFMMKGSELTSPQAQEWVVLTLINLLLFSLIFEPIKVLIMNRYRHNWPYF